VTRPVPGLSIEQQTAEVVAVMLVYGEARNQRDVGMCGPLCVALNRAYKNRPYSLSFQEDPGRLHDVMLYPYAFSCFNEKDPNRIKLLSAWKDDPTHWGACMAVSDLVLAGACGDVSQGATHYCTKALWNTPGIAWHQEQEITSGRTIKTTELGDHVYARAPGKFL
jgi:N-acetylmuramoyl-L-alanine amidase